MAKLSASESDLLLIVNKLQNFLSAKGDKINMRVGQKRTFLGRRYRLEKLDDRGEVSELEVYPWLTARDMHQYLQGMYDGVYRGYPKGFDKGVIHAVNATKPLVMPDSVADLKNKHVKTWIDQPQSYWMTRLHEEVAELCLALAGQHDDDPNHELSQIAAICINWLNHRTTDWNLEGVPGDNDMMQDTYALRTQNAKAWKVDQDSGITIEAINEVSGASKALIEAQTQQAEAEKKLRECQDVLATTRLINDNNRATAIDRKEIIAALTNELARLLRTIQEFFIFIETHADPKFLHHASGLLDFRHKLSINHLARKGGLSEDVYMEVARAFSYYTPPPASVEVSGSTGEVERLKAAGIIKD